MELGLRDHKLSFGDVALRLSLLVIRRGNGGTTDLVGSPLLRKGSSGGFSCRWFRRLRSTIVIESHGCFDAGVVASGRIIGALSLLSDTQLEHGDGAGDRCTVVRDQRPLGCRIGAEGVGPPSTHSMIFHQYS